MTTQRTKATRRVALDLGIVNQVTDRQHVSKTNLGVCRAIYRALSKTGRALKWRKTRKLYYRAAIKRHANNQDLFSYVMRGGF